MFSVISIPTKFSKTIKRLSDKEKAQLLSMLIDIGDGVKIQYPDSITGDIISLIYGEWMNMESRNGNKPQEPLIEYIPEGPGTVISSDPGHRVEYNRVEYSIIDISSKEETTALDAPEEFGKKEINQIIDTIKQTLSSIGLIYKAGPQERQRAQNILTGKEFGEICEKSNMSREQFVISIIKLSSKLDFWNGKIYNCQTFYKHYAQVYNEARRIKQEKEQKISHKSF